MKIPVIIIHLTVFFCMLSSAKAQDTLNAVQSKTDSLRQLVDTHIKQDEEKVRLLNEYAREAFYDMDFMAGLKATHEAHELSKDIDFEGVLVMYYETLSMFCGYGSMADYYQKQAEWLSIQHEKNL